MKNWEDFPKLLREAIETGDKIEWQWKNAQQLPNASLSRSLPRTIDEQKQRSIGRGGVMQFLSSISMMAFRFEKAR